MDAWMYAGCILLLAIIALIAFKIAHDTHRQDRDSDRLMLSDAALGGGPELVKAVGNAAEKLAVARGKAPRWRRIEGSATFSWDRFAPSKSKARDDEKKGAETGGPVS